MTTPLQSHGTTATIAIENPATGRVIAHIEDMTADHVAELVVRARAAQPAWAEIGFDRRAELVRKLRSWFVANRASLIDTIVAENGKTREDALLAELFYLADSMGFWAKNAGKYLAEDKIRTHSPFVLGKKVVVRYRPHGVVGVIAPWNYPLTASVGDALPALMAGNTVVLKPSEVAPLAVEQVVRGAIEVGFPIGVLQVATGAGDTGAALVDCADMIQFTGSTRTGRRIAARCGERLIPSSLELGGKDPMIVLADANVERAANVAVEWSIRNAGQICMGIERVYVEAPVYDEFVSKITEKVSRLRIGAPGDYGSTDVGAITFAPQLDIIESHIGDATAKGARVLVGGKREPGAGRFFQPTVLVDVNHTMKVMQEETFGPILPIMKVRDDEEAVRLANDTPYGLGSTIFSRNIAQAHRLARRMVAGNTWINDAIMSFLAQEAPFAGAGQSGFGSGRHGKDGIRKYCDTQTILTTRFALTREPTMFPNNARRSRRFDRLMMMLWGR
ncbi:acyl-CoA reductase-like NAD-dependent aldehyde dehydrogenase [Rhodococcus wratislaviensis]|uniref:Aldehyde dehydrogenase n=1 Tax=Rhodococcus wratislaviensis TaxID=44752 RepID=A0AB38F8I5_RHOWR|nr:aldehyde dehydrogenase family protein [Rhodococcus wratislaviensis]REE73107.1 acyl-CoA reductase-like NAD-dependent aldehyde dehydrogenase [Rhodococcus wratislaviensis]SPZ37897.1 aldehyde dehydrogenase [Rhodococcus wratislaviensis]